MQRPGNRVSLIQVRMADDHLDILLLQERCRKDPMSYYDEYKSQRRHFDALLTSARLNPSSPCPRLTEVASFMGAVAHCYKRNGEDDGNKIVGDIVTFLTDNGAVMDADLRRSLVRLLGLLRARDSADPTVIIPLFFRLLECHDKALRHMLHGHIVSDIKKLNASGHSSRRQLQTFLFSMMEDPSEALVKRGLHVLVDLFRKRIWNDAKCANMIATACFHPSTSVAVIASKFLLDSESKSGDIDGESDDDDEDNTDDTGAAKARVSRDGKKAADLWKAYNLTGKKTSKKRKRMERVINRLTRSKPSGPTSAVLERPSSHPSFEALLLLNDPQDFAERLFRDLQTRRKKESYEIRLVFINLISRLVGTHHLILFNLYPFLQRYLHPSQPEVTRALAYLTQACHDLVPSDVLHPILRGLADTFVSERSSPMSMAAGINAIRAICSRVPLAILDEENENLSKGEQEAPLLLDLVQYKNSKDKGVVMAARSLVTLYREVQPSLLHKRDRGKAASEAVQRGSATMAAAYGEHMYATGVDGVELLGKGFDDEEDGVSSDGSEDGNLNGDEDGVGGDAIDGIGDDAIDGIGGEDLEVDVKTGEEGSSDVEDDSANDDGQKTNEVEKQDQDVTEAERDDIAKPGESSEKEEELDTDDEGKSSEHVDVCENENDVSSEDGDEEGTNGNEDDEGSDSGGDGEEVRKDTVEILSQEDYARIRARRAAAVVGSSLLTKNTGKAVTAEEIQGPVKRERRTLEERLETVLAGREGREKFGSRKGDKKGGGSTNKKKLKSKSNSMVIHKRRKRNKMSRREKQISKRRKRDYK